MIAATVFLGALAGILALILIGAMWKGYVLTVLWAWFVAPTFGLPEINLAPAVGLAMVASFLTYQVDAIGDQKLNFKKHLMALALGPAAMLGIGWIVHKFM